MIGSFFLALVAQELSAGAAVVDITPEKGPVVVNGMFTERSADRAHDRLFVRALALGAARDNTMGHFWRVGGGKSGGSTGFGPRPRAWVHLVVICDGGRLAVHLDNRASKAWDGPPPRLGPLRLHGLDGEPTFEGRLDEIAVYDRALSAEEIEAHRRAAER